MFFAFMKFRLLKAWANIQQFFFLANPKIIFFELFFEMQN